MNVDHRTGPLRKADLKYPYQPDAHGSGDLKSFREPDEQELRRHDWYEMLYFVNKFSNTNGLGSLGVARHAEILIHEHVPHHLRSHDQIRKWLLDNWKFFS
ncbi:hypothetical protein BH11PSE11_BH11PSE11_04220 [soil metagenome]